MIRYILFLLSLSSYIGYTQSTNGYIIYKASLTESFEYSKDFRTNYPDEYKEMLVKDSITASSEIGVVFNTKMSRSFATKPIGNKSEKNHEALYKINLDAEYYYNSKDKMSTIYRDFWFNHLLISVDVMNKWEIDYKKTKIIDGYKCFYAKYKGRYLWSPSSSERVTYAWFTTEIPLPFGPLHYAGLPGLIVEMNDDNVRYTATKIVFDNTYISKLKPIDPQGKEQITEQTFIDTRMEIIKRAKRIMIGN